MKTLKFREHLVGTILDGSKTLTWRLFDDKNLQIGDRVEFLISDNGSKFAEAEIVALEEKPFGEVTEDELRENHYRSRQEALELNRKIYGSRVSEETLVKIVKFRLLPEMKEVHE